MLLKELVSLQEVLVFELLLQQLVLLVQVLLLQVPDRSFTLWGLRNK